MPVPQFDMRKSGIASVEELPWGSHVCQFYETKDELLEVLVPYFRAGLENNEFCSWIVDAPLSIEEAENALRRAVPRLSEYLEAGQLEIVSSAGCASPEWEVNRAILAKLDCAVTKSLDGLRFACPVLSELHGVPHLADGIAEIGLLNVLAIFLYPRNRFDAVGLMGVVKRHRLALVRGADRWEVLESSEALTVKDALKRTEDKLHSLFNNMSEGFAFHRIILDATGKPRDYVFLEINEAFARLTGLDAGLTIGKRVTEVFPGIEKDPADWIGRYGAVALTGKPVHFESYADSLQRWYSVSAFSPRKGFFACTFADITERRQAEEKIRHQTRVLAAINRIFREAIFCESEEQLCRLCLSVAVEITGSRFGIIHEVKDPCQLICLAISDADRDLCRTQEFGGHDGIMTDPNLGSLYGRVLRECRGFFSNEAVTDSGGIAWPANLPRLEAFMAVPLVEQGKAAGIVVLGNRPGGYRPEDLSALEALAEPILQVLMRRRAEIDRHALEERLAVTLRSIGDAVLSTDAEGRITFINPVATALTGWPESEALGRPLSEVFHIVDEITGKPGEEIISQVLSEKRPVTLANHTALIARDGRNIPVEDSAAPIFAADGRITGAVLVFHDATVKRRAQQALQRYQEELEDRVARRTQQLEWANRQVEARAAQLRALASELTLAEQRERRRIAKLLHDNLQQILVGAKFQVSTLGRSADTAVRSASTAINALLDEAIQASRSLTAEISPPILYERGLVPALRWLVGWIAEKHGLTVELSSGTVPERLAEDVNVLLFESVREILFNVVKHAGVNKAFVDVRSAGGKLEITIRDQGSGFSPDSLPSSGASGGGFGLFSIRERLGLLGGELRIESLPGNGTKVMLFAPAVAASPPRVRQRRPHAGAFGS